MIMPRKEYTPSNLSVYQYFIEKTKDMADCEAISFFGKSIKYSDLYASIDEVERALRACGVGVGDVVASSLPGIPEAISLIYAINKIGAIYCAFDCRGQGSQIEDMLKKFNPKVCFVPDFQLTACKNIHDCKIVCIAPAHFIGGAIKYTDMLCDLFLGRILLKSQHKNIVSYDQFIKDGKSEENKPAAINENNRFGYFYTSGTTYGRKSIILSNEHINAAATQLSEEEGYLDGCKSLLNIMPLFTCYGWTVGMHMPLTVGIRVSLVPLLKPKKLKKFILKEKPNLIITVPSHWEYFIADRFDNCDLSFLKNATVGGDKISPKYEEKINSILKECASSAFLRSCYGLSETATGGFVPNANTPKGSVGKPLCYMTAEIFDKDSLEPLPVGEKGEICMMGPTICEGYYKDPEMTNMLLKKHPDGNIWLHTGDMGYFDKDGNLFFCERLKRMYVRFDGTKISPYSIESVILQHPDVEHCLVLPVKDEDHSHGMCAKALVVLKKGINKSHLRTNLAKYLQENLGRHMQPKYIEFVDRLPYTKSGKLDCFGHQK